MKIKILTAILASLFSLSVLASSYFTCMEADVLVIENI
jgi:uncharacterized protein YccT (UPF0319 family)